MRLTTLIAASAAALALAACQNNDTAAENAAANAEASADTTAMSPADSTTDASSASGSMARSGTASGETMSPSTGVAATTDGAMVASATPPAAAGDNETDTERRLNPPQNTVPAQ